MASKLKAAAGNGKRPRKRNALALLKDDHAEVAALFEDYEKGRNRLDLGEKRALAAQICEALSLHAQIEEEIFYPTVRPQITDSELVAEARVEHGSLKELIAGFEGEEDEEMFDARVKVLGEYVKHHVKEEQNELFPEVRKTGIDLATLGEALANRKAMLARR